MIFKDLSVLLNGSEISKKLLCLLQLRIPCYIKTKKQPLSKLLFVFENLYRLFS